MTLTRTTLFSWVEEYGVDGAIQKVSEYLDTTEGQQELDRRMVYTPDADGNITGKRATKELVLQLLRQEVG